MCAEPNAASLQLLTKAHASSRKGDKQIAEQSELLTDAILVNRIADIWPHYPCLYDATSPNSNNREMRQKAFQETTERWEKQVSSNSKSNLSTKSKSNVSSSLPCSPSVSLSAIVTILFLSGFLENACALVSSCKLAASG